MALRVTQVRSAIGTKPKQRGTLRALGLGRIGRSNTLPDRPEIWGMINRVPHLVNVEVEEVEEAADPPEGRAEQGRAQRAQQEGRQEGADEEAQP